MCYHHGNRERFVVTRPFDGIKIPENVSLSLCYTNTNRSTFVDVKSCQQQYHERGSDHHQQQARQRQQQSTVVNQEESTTTRRRRQATTRRVVAIIWDVIAFMMTLRSNNNMDNNVSNFATTIFNIWLAFDLLLNLFRQMSRKEDENNTNDDNKIRKNHWLKSKGFDLFLILLPLIIAMNPLLLTVVTTPAIKHRKENIIRKIGNFIRLVTKKQFRHNIRRIRKNIIRPLIYVLRRSVGIRLCLLKGRKIIIRLRHIPKYIDMIKKMKTVFICLSYKIYCKRPLHVTKEW